MGRPDAHLLQEKYFGGEDLCEHKRKESLFSIEIVIHSIIVLFFHLVGVPRPMMITDRLREISSKSGLFLGTSQR